MECDRAGSLHPKRPALFSSAKAHDLEVVEAPAPEV